MVSRAPRVLQIALVATAAVLLGIGAWLRALTHPWQSHMWTIDWLSYYQPQAEALSSFRLHDWLGSWVGLHPPVAGALHAVIMVLGGSLVTHWTATVSAGLLAVVVLSRPLFGGTQIRAALGMLLLTWGALSPLQVNYGLITTSYPWALLICAGATVALLRATEVQTNRSWLLAGVLVGLACETHVLGVAVIIGHGLWLLVQGPTFWTLHKRGLVRWGVAVGLLILPVLIGGLTKTSDPWTFHIGEGDYPWWGTASIVFFDRFASGPSATTLGIVLAIGALGGVVLKPRGLPGLLAISTVGWLAALLLFILGHVADPRLSYYYLVPQLLAFGLAAVGWAELLERTPEAWRTPLAGVALSVMLGVTGWWAVDSITWQLERRARAETLIAEAGDTPETVRALYTEAGPGDVVAYLWDYQFLDDEPEHLDPIAAKWPPGRLGRRCPEENPPRGMCNAFGSARFYFNPSAFSDELWEVEEPLRLMVNKASAPGSARILMLSGPESPSHPWPADAWLEQHGGQRRALAADVVLWEFPAGTRIEPPLVPFEPPPPEEQDTP